MFSVLLASQRTGVRSHRQIAASLLIHLGLLGWALHATASPAVPPAPIREAPMLIAPPARAPVPRPAVAPAIAARPSGLPLPARPLLVRIPELVTLPPPGSAPDLAILGRQSSIPPGGEAPDPDERGHVAYLEAGVDEPTELLGSLEPRFPPALRQSGMEGRVLVEFVVDTIGRVESDSWQVLDATHPLFAKAVRQVVFRARFRPARIRGRPVRQRVRLPVRFTLTPGPHGI